MSECELERAAQQVLDEVDRNLGTRPWPFKYAAPWGALNRLRAALQAQKKPPGSRPRVKVIVGRKRPKERANPASS